jgi:2-keto-4-pentenoate hydratase/2-oxohepta-3-ene-1,7-dioic acid hydratase in catechol pathway
MENAAIFLKPPTACVSMSNPIDLRGHTDVICETEVALLIGSGIARSKTGCSRSVAEAAVEGYTIAFDLTRKDLQTRLKNAGKPWELSKAFDGACPLGAFSKDSISRDATVELEVNGDIILSQPLTNMILSYTELIQLLSQYFTLCPGDVILTGTPTKPQLPPRLNSGDRLVASIGTRIRVETTAV